MHLQDGCTGFIAIRFLLTQLTRPILLFLPGTRDHVEALSRPSSYLISPQKFSASARLFSVSGDFLFGGVVLGGAG